MIFWPFGRADLFVGHDDEAHRRDRAEPDRLGEGTERVGDDDEPALHVEHARTAREVAVATKPLERSWREHRVEVADERDGLLRRVARRG